jgi:hypothetical protein
MREGENVKVIARRLGGEMRIQFEFLGHDLQYPNQLW